MNQQVYKRPQYRPRVAITPELQQQILAGLQTTSQQKLARILGVSQTAISRVARLAAASAPRESEAVS
jgi:predicted transcriptional regulator